MRPFQKDAILVLVSKPVDLLTQFAQELSGLPASQVLGCGTCLDSIRLRELLAAKVGVCKSIFADFTSNSRFRQLEILIRSFRLNRI
jgi:malate/lactate dehydrogenase